MVKKEFLTETQRVWSRLYGRPVSEAEALEIICNVNAFYGVLSEELDLVSSDNPETIMKHENGCKH